MTTAPASAAQPDAHARAQAPGTRGSCTYGLTEQQERGIRSLTTGPGATPHHVVIVPGLGALGYLVPLVGELGRRGLQVTLLDLPGFGRRDGLGCAPTVADVAAAAVRWTTGLPPGERPVLFGHSTGAQAALLAAVQLQDAAGALVLAGPTVAPNQRSLPRLIARAPLAYRRESPTELSVLGDYRRAGRDVLVLLRSAIADRPERTVRELRLPLLVTAGRQDSFAPPGWLVTLTHAAASRSARVLRLPGSHNNPYTHPAALATVVEAMAGEAASLRRVRRTRRAGATVERSA